MPDNRIDLTIAAQNNTRPAFEALTKQLANVDRHSARTARSTTAGFRALLPAIQQVNDTLAKMETRSRGTGRGFRLLGQDIQTTANIVQQFSRVLTSQTRAIIQEAANIERLRLGLNTLSPSIAEAEAQYRRLISVARLPGIDFSNALRASLQLQAIGKSGEEATRILIAFGNSLALSGASTADIQRTIYGLRQLIADGKVYQRELNLITSRVPIATPILQQRFGGVRADNIRSYFESIGVDESQQAAEFIKILTEELEKLPRSSETAANALENLGDTSRRVQGAIGENLLPAVKEATAAIEGLLLSVEKDEGLKTATADALAFATTMGGVSAGILGVAAVIPLLAGLAGPIGIAALAAGALAGAFVTAEVQAARFREEYNRTQNALKNALQIGRGEDIKAIQQKIEALEARRTVLQNQIKTAEEAAQAEEDSQLRIRRGEPNPFRKTAGQILEASESYEIYQSQLFQTNEAIEVLTRRTNELGEAQEAVAATAKDRLAGAFQSLTDAASGTDAEIAEALQRLENAGGDDRVTDLALDIGDQLIAIAEATSVKQVEASKKRVDALARDKSLIIADNKELQALLLASEEAFVARRREIQQQEDAARRKVQRQEDAAYRDAFTLRTHDEEASALSGALLRFQDLQRDVQEAVELDAQQSAEGQATAYIRAYRDTINPVILNLVESVRTLREELRGSIQAFERLNAQDALTLEIQGEIGGERSDALAELFDLNQAVQDGIRENEIANLRQRSVALKEKLADDTLSLQQYQTDAIAILRSVDDAERAFQAVDVREDLNKRQAANALKLSQTILALEDATKEGQIERILETAQERQRALAGSEGALKVIYNRFVQLEQDAQDKRAGIILGGKVADARKELARLQERTLDAQSSRRLQIVQREVQQTIDRYAESGDTYAGVIRELTTLHQDLGGAIEEAFRAERIERFREAVQGVLSDIIGLSLHRFSLTDTIVDTLKNDVPTVRFDAELNEFIFDENVFRDVSDALAGVTLNVENLSDAVIGAERSLRLVRFQEDASTQRQRLGEDAAEGIRRLQAQRRRLLASRPTGDQRATERTNQRIQDVTARIAEARREAQIRGERFEEDTETRRTRLIEDALNRQAQAQSAQTSVFEDIGQTIETAMKNALADQLAGYLTGTAFDAGVGLITAGLGALGIGDLLGKIGGFLGIGGDGDGTGTPTTPQTPEVQAEAPDLTGKINVPAENITVPEGALDFTGKIALALSDITAPVEAVDLTGRIAAIEELSESVKLPPVPGLTGGIGRLVLPPGVDRPIVPGLVGEIAQIQLAEGLTLPTLPAIRVPIIYDVPDLPEGNVEVGQLEPVGPPGEPPTPSAAAEEGIPGIINAQLNLAFETPVELTGVVNAEINKLFDESVTVAGRIDVDLPSFTEMVELQAQIVGLGLDASLPDIDLTARIAQLHLAENLDIPGVISSITIATGEDAPNPPSVDGLIGIISELALATGEDVPNPPSVDGLIGIISELALATGEDVPNPPSVDGLIGIIDSIGLDPDVDLPTIRIPATAVVGPVTGGQGQGQGQSDIDIDPENPPLDGGGLEGSINSLNIDPTALSSIQPVDLSGVINARLNLLFDEPIILSGRIDATVNYITGANVGDGGGGGGGGGQGGDEDPVQRSQVSEDISTIARALENAAVSGNLDPELGPTPRVDIPAILDKLNQQTNFSDDQAQRENPGFGDILRSVNQFRQETGGQIGGAWPSGSLRVTLPTEAFAELAQETTLQSGFIFANDHLAIIRTLLANDDAAFATETTLAGMAETLDRIELATERIADQPLVDQLIEAGVAFPQSLEERINSFLPDVLSQGGLNQFSTFGNLNRRIETGELAPDLAQIGSEERPGFFNVANLPEIAGLLAPADMSLMPGGTADNPAFVSLVNLPAIQKVEVTNPQEKVEVTNEKINVEGSVKAEVSNTVGVRQVGSFAVTQAGQFVVQLASGNVIPVEIIGGLEGLSISLSEVNVELEAVGAI